MIVVASASGAPGATTTALGLALHWPRHVLLADLDRDPAQAIPAGYLRGVEIGGRGLTHVARAHRERRNVAEELWLQTIELDESGPLSRRFLPGFTHPGAARLFEPVWSEVASALAGLGSTGTDVVVDAGRVGAGLPAALVDRADAVLVCARTSLRSLAGLRVHLASLTPADESSSQRAQVGLVLVGPGRPYGAKEVSEQFGLPVWGEVAWEPRQAAVLSDGEAPPRGFGSSRLARSCRALAVAVDERISVRHDVIDGSRDASWWPVGAR